MSEAATSSSATQDAEMATTVATAELYSSNLLRLESSEMLKESVLHVSPHSGELKREVKWANQLRDYVTNVKDVLSNMKSATLNPDIATISGSSSTESSSKDDNKGGLSSSWIALHSDKATTKQNVPWEFTFSGGQSLQIEAVGCYGAGGVGLTTSNANAQVLPTIDIAVLMPSFLGDQDQDEIGMVGGKDYLNHRYFDKRNIFALHVAKYLSQKKQRKNIGSVHFTQQDGDARKVALLLTHPLLSSTTTGDDDDDNDDGQKMKKKHKKNDGSSEKKHIKKSQSKHHFRVRLLFGTQNQPSKINTSGFWIPPARLFPNRNNNKMTSPAEQQQRRASPKPTPNYNNSIAQDMHYVSTTRIIQTTAKFSKSFQDSVTLAKIWCLQRGFLRGHDSFTTSTIALIITYLYRTKMIGKRMGSLQVFTVFVKLFAETDWLGENQFQVEESDDNTIRHSGNEGYQDYRNHSSAKTKKKKTALVLPENGMNEKQTYLDCIQNRLYASDYKENEGMEDSKTLLDCFKINTDGPVFLDPTMTYNYFGLISPSFIRDVQLEAKSALKCMHQHSNGTSNGRNPFKQLFLEHCRFWRRYDAFVRLDLNTINFPKSIGEDKISCLWGDDRHDVGDFDAISRGLVRVLRMALGNRVTAIRVLSNGNGEKFGTNISKEEKSSSIASKTIVDSDENISIPIAGSLKDQTSFRGYQHGKILSPVAKDKKQDSSIVVGVCLNPQTCQRLVDRGPPADDTDATASFISLWGKQRAQLRRFKDGAIVHAVVWNTVEHDSDEGYIQFSGDERNGAIVERIIRHIIKVHFNSDQDANSKRNAVQFSLRGMSSLIEAPAVSSSNDDVKKFNSIARHMDVMSAFDVLSTFLRKNSVSSAGSKLDSSPLGLPLAIDAVEGLSPCLRYSELFPPTPHPLLGGTNISDLKKVSGVAMGHPILLQIRFEGSNKWPTDLKAMGAAKCALLIQLAKGIEKMKELGSVNCSGFGGPINVNPTYIDLGFQGYSWRIMLRADQELKTLNSLREPTPEARTLRQTLTKQHIIRATHHSLIHAVHTQHPSAGAVVRLLRRWIAAHMLSGLIPVETVELIVASVFTAPAPLKAPSTISSGFTRALKLLSSHDWVREPLIVDPHGHISDEERSQIYSQFESARGPIFQGGPSMYLISPNDCDKGIPDENSDETNIDNNVWKPTFTTIQPEKVILLRVCALARRSYDHLLHNTVLGDCSTSENISWVAAFQESSTSLKSYDVLLRVDPGLIVDKYSSSTGVDRSLVASIDVDTNTVHSAYTRSLDLQTVGHKKLRKKMYKNLNNGSSSEGILHSWNPVECVLKKLRSKFGHLAVFFYNEYAPDIIAILWRPKSLQSHPFSVLHSEYKRPVEDNWKDDSLASMNTEDILRELHFHVRDIVIDVKVMKK